MRLLNAKQIRLESFPNAETPYVPDYVILSHRWRDREISFQEIQSLTPELENTDGYMKIKRCCEIAVSVGFDYVWVDTCCIDKTNLVDLSESLNSMFQWYRQAQACYAYLFDVPSDEDPSSKNSKFRTSQWFTRGWTLQALVAPLSLTFFGEDWKEVGSKSSLYKVISEITGITWQVLLSNHAGEISVAQRMSWAAERETARVEDQAYCLMGLFGVRMPILYGEGENAFIRLQLEIIKTSDDQSIFAWTSGRQGSGTGLLATSPKDFKHCGNTYRHGETSQTSEFSITNKGMHIHLPMIPVHCAGPDKRLFLGVLGCQFGKGPYPLGIYLESCEKDPKSYTRVRVNEVKEMWSSFFESKTEVYVREKDPTRLEVSDWMKVESQYIFCMRNRPPGNPSVFHNDYCGWTINEGEIRLRFRGSGHSGVLVFKNSTGQAFAVVMGIHNWNTWCDIMPDVENMDFEGIAREFWEGSRSYNRWNNWDRKSDKSANGGSISVVIRKGRLEGQRVYFVNVEAGSQLTLTEAGPACCFPDGW
ncbi:hypothetical protein F4779DRAFT_610172 [Xylariaceae sp. FL0662B]|nr:hypothetical protein F4779DRAFT_610172 [Xylariaceae sp. FL0662B]